MTPNLQGFSYFLEYATKIDQQFYYWSICFVLIIIRFTQLHTHLDTYRNAPQGHCTNKFMWFSRLPYIYLWDNIMANRYVPLPNFMEWSITKRSYNNCPPPSLLPLTNFHLALILPLIYTPTTIIYYNFDFGRNSTLQYSSYPCPLFLQIFYFYYHPLEKYKTRLFYKLLVSSIRINMLWWKLIGIFNFHA